MAECKQCGEAIPDDASFCSSCGAPQLDGAAVTPTGALAQELEGDGAAEDEASTQSGAEQPEAAGASVADAVPAATASDAGVVEAASEQAGADGGAAASAAPAAEPVEGAPAFKPQDAPVAAQSAVSAPQAASETAPSAGTEPAPAAPQVAPVSAPVSGSGAEPHTPPVDGSSVSQSAPAPDAGLMPQGQPVDPRSPLKRAWADFKTSPGHWVMPAKLALLQLVPVAGIVAATGYIQQWGAEQAFGRREPLPRRIVRPGVLEAGFNAVLTSCVLGVIMLCINFVLDGLTGGEGAGEFISMVLSLLVSPLFAVMTLRSAICWRVKPGLSVSRAWKMLTTQGKTGPLFAAVLVPSLLVAVIAVVVLMVFFSIITMQVSASMAAYSMSYYYYGDVSEMLVGALPFLLLNIAVFAFIVLFFANIAGLVSTRAVGYWLRDFAPETWQEYQEGAAADIANHPLDR